MGTNERLLQVIYLKFGSISDCVNHALEANIIKYLAQKKIGPKLFYEDPNGNFRITEYLEGTSTIERPKGLDEAFVKQIYEIFNFFTIVFFSDF